MGPFIGLGGFAVKLPNIAPAEATEFVRVLTRLKSFCFFNDFSYPENRSSTEFPLPFSAGLKYVLPIFNLACF